MNFSYNWLQSFFNTKLPKPKELADLLSMHAFEVEEVKKQGGDFVLSIDVLSNRGHDCLCYLGMAREIAAILNRKLIVPPKNKLLVKKGKIPAIKFNFARDGLVPRYSAIVVENLKVGKASQWMQKRLDVSGVRSVNNIVDLTNFLMLETGQPLHAFDYDKILGQKMTLRRSKAGEEIITLDGKTRDLPEGTLIIEDAKRLIDLVGIMGGGLSEIDSATKNIVLQAGNFDRKIIYRTAKKMRHQTFASKIYGHGIDPNLTIAALERASRILRETGLGKIVQFVDFYPKKALPFKIKLDLDYVERLLGTKIRAAEIKNILKRLGFAVSQSFVVEVPTFRLDINIQEDLIEEIGRIHGYQKIKPQFPFASLIPPKMNFELFWENMVKDILKEAGFSESYNYSFISLLDKKFFKEENLVEVENPISSEQQYLRPSLIHNLLKNINKNQKLFREIKIFEMGRIFKKCQMSNVKNQVPASRDEGEDENGVLIAGQMLEKRMLTGIITGDAFYQAKGVVDLLLNKMGISGAWYDEYQPTPEESNLSIWRKKRCAEIKTADHEEFGFIGEISTEITEAVGIDDKVVVFDIDFEKLQRLASDEHEYQPISVYPAAVRDIAVLVPGNVRIEEVLNVIESAGGKPVRDVDLFDIYEGEELPEGKKNLAFHIIYQAEDRALRSEEIEKLQQKIVEALEKNADWEVRR